MLAVAESETDAETIEYPPTMTSARAAREALR
jgi:hypothetical protein